MIYVQHRVNSISQLQKTPLNYGVEIDIRNHGSRLLVEHDPFVTDAPDLCEWLESYNHRFLIVNVKEEGLEPELFALLERYKVKDFFILDESLPYIRKYALEGVSNFAVRVSEYETVETALELQAHLRSSGCKVDWIWLDTFTGHPLPSASIARLKSAGFRLCQVSPEYTTLTNLIVGKNVFWIFKRRLEKLVTLIWFALNVLVYGDKIFILFIE